MSKSGDIHKSKHHAKLSDAEPAALKPPSYKSFNEAYRALQERRAAAGKLTIPTTFNRRMGK